MRVGCTSIETLAIERTPRTERRIWGAQVGQEIAIPASPREARPANTPGHCGLKARASRTLAIPTPPEETAGGCEGHGLAGSAGTKPLITEESGTSGPTDQEVHEASNEMKKGRGGWEKEETHN